MRKLTLSAKLIQAALFVAASTAFMIAFVELPGGATTHQLYWSRTSDAAFNVLAILLRDQIAAIMNWSFRPAGSIRSGKGTLYEGLRTLLEIVEIALVKVPLYWTAATLAQLDEATTAKGMLYTGLGSVALWTYAKKYEWAKRNCQFQWARFRNPTSLRARVLARLTRLRRKESPRERSRRILEEYAYRDYRD